MTDRPEPISLESSWRVYLTGIVSSLILATAATVAIVVGGRLAVVPVILIGLSVAIAAVTAFDTPRATVLDAGGIRRQCLLRTHVLEWTAVDTIARAPALSRARVRDSGGNASEVRVSGGLTAAAGRHRHLLCDVAEDSRTYELLARALDDWAPEVRLRAAPPNA